MQFEKLEPSSRHWNVAVAGSVVNAKAADRSVVGFRGWPVRVGGSTATIRHVNVVVPLVPSVLRARTRNV